MDMRSWNTFLWLIFLAFWKTDFIAMDTTLDWWQTTVIYQIYPRSFKDSNSDGIGDLKGIEEKAEYLKDLGVGTVWLSPIFKSPMDDMGYDISDFKDIDPIFGTMADFESLRDKVHSLGMYLTLDFVPNHSSDEHEWFKKSVQKIDPYTNYYVWKDPKAWINETTPVPPNNWISAFQGSSWTYVPERKQYYLHQFARKQPDLNYRSSELLEEMKNVIRFWLDRGVDGFRMDAVPFLIEDDQFLDEPIINPEFTINGIPAFDAVDHKYTQCLQGTYDILRQFREVLDSYKQKDGKTRLMMVEAYATLNNTMRFFGTKTQPIAHIPFNFFLLTRLKDESTASDFQTAINDWMNNMPQGEWPNWVLGNHDNRRIAEKFDPSSVDSLNTLLLLLPGTPITYNGEEIGMEGMKIRWDQTTDVGALNVGPLLYNNMSRDPERAPLQWNSSIHAGFSDTKNKTWLPVNPNYYKLNVEAQKNDPKSHLNIYKNLTKLRSKDVFRLGGFKTYIISERVFAFKRNLHNEIYLIVMNLNNEEEFVDIKNTVTDVSNEVFKIALASQNSRFEVGEELNTSNSKFRMSPKSSIVLQAV